MRKPRARPKYLHTKLFVIRQRLELSQYKMAQQLEIAYYTRVSEYESGRREPNLLVLLRYARLANIPVEALIDDTMQLPLINLPERALPLEVM